MILLYSSLGPSTDLAQNDVKLIFIEWVSEQTIQTESTEDVPVPVSSAGCVETKEMFETEILPSGVTLNDLAFHILWGGEIFK